MMKLYEIKLPFPATISKSLTKIILDIVEKLPQFQGGIIFDLQAQRKFQRNEEERHFDQTRCPEGVKLDFIGLRIFESYPIEKFSILDKIIENLFSQTNSFFGSRARNSFSLTRQSVFAGHWAYLGHIVKKDDRRIYSVVLRRIELPPEIDSIEVTLIKSLPSEILLLFDVAFTEVVSKELHKLQSKKYLSDVQFTSVNIPHLNFSSIQNISEQVQKKQLVEYKDQIQNKIENILSPFLKGEYFNKKRNKPSLPTIEIYQFEANEKITSNYSKWSDDNRFWLNSLGFDFFDTCFSNSDFCIYQNNIEGLGGKLRNYKFLVFPKGDNEENQNENKINRLYTFSRISRLINSITTPIALCYQQNIYLHIIQSVREKTYSKIVDTKNNMNSVFNEFVGIQEIFRKIERHKSEFQEQESIIVRNMDIPLFNTLYKNQSKKGLQTDKFSDEIIKQIKYNNELLFSNASVLERYFSRYSDFLNTKSLYNFQNTANRLTLAALIIGLINLFFFIDQLIEILDSTITIIRQLILIIFYNLL